MDMLDCPCKNRDQSYDDPRRTFLVKALTLGLFATGGMLAGPRRAFAETTRLLSGRSIHQLRGDVRVNGTQADHDTRIPGNAAIETGANGSLIFVVGKDAFIMRENSRLRLHARTPALASASGSAEEDGFGSTLVDGLRLLTGALLSVFGERGAGEDLNLYTSTATIGIRGTGVYLEAAKDRSYICTCYGTTAISAADDPQRRERIRASHHEARYVFEESVASRLIEPAPLIHHTDMELRLIERLVGRTPPFDAAGSGSSGASRRSHY